MVIQPPKIGEPESLDTVRETNILRGTEKFYRALAIRDPVGLLF